MDSWLTMLRSTYNWSLADRIKQYYQQFILADYCDLRTRAEACPLTCFVSKNGATGEPWKDSKIDFEGKLKNPRRSAGEVQITALPDLKKAFPWFGEIDSTVLQQNVKRLDVAYKNFFEGRGFPTFKNRSNFTSFTFTSGILIQYNKVYLPKIGWMRFFNSRTIPDGFTIKAATARKRQDGWYISVRIEDKTIPEYTPKPLSEVKSVIGVDLGLTKLAHLSDKYQFDNPRFSTNRKTKRLLKVRQRRISRKLKGSKNRKKSSQLVGRLHKKIADKRSAYHWEVAKVIVNRKVNAIAIEDLNVVGMMKRCRVKIDDETGRFLPNGQSRKVGLNRAIADAGWTNLTTKIEYMAAKYGLVVVKVNPRYSSCECQKCGHIDKTNRDKEKFICTRCSFMEHADFNAAKVLKQRAIEIIELLVRRDSPEFTPENLLEISARPRDESVEPGNLSNQDIKAAMS